MSQQNSQINDNNYKKNLIKNSGCCGAASDGWVPSYPSLPIKIDNNKFLVKNQSLSDKSETESESESESLVFIKK